MEMEFILWLKCLTPLIGVILIASELFRGGPAPDSWGVRSGFLWGSGLFGCCGAWSLPAAILGGKDGRGEGLLDCGSSNVGLMLRLRLWTVGSFNGGEISGVILFMGFLSRNSRFISFDLCEV